MGRYLTETRYRTMNDMGEQSEDRLLTQEEREEAMRSAGQLQRETDQPVSVFEAVCVAQDAKTAESMQAQMDAAEADAARSMAAYKDAYAATQLMGQMLEERGYETLLNHADASDNDDGMGSNRDVTVGNSGAVEIG